MFKKEIRKYYSQQRTALSDADFLQLSRQMVDLFGTLSLQGIQYLLSYYPIPEKKEFDVTICEQLLSLENAQLTVLWPRLQLDGVTMEAHVKTAGTVLEKNRFNILEPVNTEQVEAQLIDAVFVPLLAFDLKGYRVGYGKGFYDRYLARCAQDVVKIGFSFFDALERIDDIDQFDVPLNYCITPSRVYEF